MKKYKNCLHLSLFIVSMIFSLHPNYAQDIQSRARNYYRYSLNRIIDHIVPARKDQKAKLFMDLDTLPFLIIGKTDAKLVKTDTMLMLDDAVHTLEFYDLDNDGVADEFHALTKEGKASEDVGFMYDLNKDGQADYIVFWGGFFITHDQQIYKYLYHWVDENYDGKIDLITSSVVNQPGDSLPDPHYVIWIKDFNADGLVDDVSFMHLPEGSMHPFAKENGKWFYNTVFGRKEVDPMDNTFFSFYYKILEKVKRF